MPMQKKLMNEAGGGEDRQAVLDEARRSARTLVEFAYGRLRQDILTGVLPPGEKLRVEQLKASYGVGSSTLREALSLLIADALVTAEGQKGFRVAPISMEDLKDVTDMRKMLEGRAVRESVETGDEEWEAGLVAAYHRLSRVEERIYDSPGELMDEWEVRNRAFHEALIAACRSKWLRHFRTILYSQSERYRRLALVSRPLPRDVREEHKAIFDAAISRDVQQAVALTEYHVDRTFESLSKLHRDLEIKPRRRA